MSPNEKYALIKAYPNNLILLNLTNKQKHKLKGWISCHSSCCFTPDSEYALDAGRGGKIRIYKTLTGILVKELEHNSNNNNNNNVHTAELDTPLKVLAVSCTPKGDKILSFANDRTLKIWDAQTYKCLKTFLPDTLELPYYVYKIDFIKDNILLNGMLRGSWLTQGSRMAIGKLNDDCLTIKKLIPGSFNSSFFTNNNNILVTIGYEAKILDQNTGKVTQTFAKHTDKILSGLLSSDGTLAVTTYWDDTVKIFIAESGKLLTTLGFNKELDNKDITYNMHYTCACHLGSDGKLIFIHNRQVKIWNIFDPELIRELNDLSLDQKQLLALMRLKPFLKIANHPHLANIYKNLPRKTKEAVEDNFNSTLDMLAIASSNPLLLAYSLWNRYYQGK